MDYVLTFALQKEIPPLLQVMRKLFSVPVGNISGGLDDKNLVQLLLESTFTESIISSSAFD